ncbi:chymotrypsinogen A-like [Oppia nitens]|uniref:chymotrypsinogen A-like n=1 Tax=Oppia nitens TaxID=1686743 RepID=UPI0023DC615E|nr:chymotrypsinogen A-like [Oppia nitens]
MTTSTTNTTATKSPSDQSLDSSSVCMRHTIAVTGVISCSLTAIGVLFGAYRWYHYLPLVTGLLVLGIAIPAAYYLTVRLLLAFAVADGLDFIFKVFTVGSLIYYKIKIAEDCSPYDLSVLLSSVLVSFSVCIHSQIKHYPNVTLDTCGIGRQSLLTTKNCFKWSSNVTTSVQNGRLAQPGEWPWIVFIYSTYYFLGFIPTAWAYCTGVILNHYWIITAAHCIRSDFTITVRTVQDKRDESHTYGVDKWFQYKDYPKDKNINDIGLLKLNSHIGIQRSMNGRYYTVNSICLPDRDIVNTDKELALFAGFGYIDGSVSNTGPLRTGVSMIIKTFSNISDDWGKRIMGARYPANRGPALCKGDSGGPLIQYVSGGSSVDGMGDRAVHIGVSSASYGPLPVANCHNTDPNAYMVFIRVSKYIDWIIETVLTN